MDKINMSDYYSLSIKEKEEIDKFINNLKIRIDTIFEGLTSELLIKSLKIDIEDIPNVFKDIKKLRVYSGYNPYEIKFTEKGLLLREKTIRNEEDFIDVLGKIPTTQERVLNITDMSLESIEEINKSVREKRICYYEDITPKYIDEILKEKNSSLEDIFNIFKKISIIEGYRVIEVLLGEYGLRVEQEAIRNEDEYYKLLIKNNIGIE